MPGEAFATSVYAASSGAQRYETSVLSDQVVYELDVGGIAWLSRDAGRRSYQADFNHGISIIVLRPPALDEISSHQCGPQLGHVPGLIGPVRQNNAPTLFGWIEHA
jgi:hypothetical protein